MNEVTRAVAQDPMFYKASGTTVAAGTTAIAQINEYLTFVAIVISIVAGSIAIYKFVNDVRRDRRNKK